MFFDFGKHRGKHVRDVPTGYLRWVVRECDNVNPWLRRAVVEELAARDARCDDDPPPAPQPPANWSGVLRQWYRQLCLDYHPDRGGSHEAMVAINDAYDRLKRLTG